MSLVLILEVDLHKKALLKALLKFFTAKKVVFYQEHPFNLPRGEKPSCLHTTLASW